MCERILHSNSVGASEFLHSSILERTEFDFLKINWLRGIILLHFNSVGALGKIFIVSHSFQTYFCFSGSNLRARLETPANPHFQKNQFFLYVLDRFDALISKMILKKMKNIILMHFGTKSTLKNNRNPPKQARFDCGLHDHVITRFVSELGSETRSYPSVIFVIFVVFL
jgi:hypothetical protein